MPSTLAISIGLTLALGGQIGLAPSDEVDATAPEPVPADLEPGPAPPSSPGPGSTPLGWIGVAAALALIQRKRGTLSPSDGLGLTPSDPVFVFVPGHGQPSGDRAFAALIESMGLDEESVRHFDYRWVDGGPLPGRSSSNVPIDDAAAALNAYVAGVAADGRDVYLVGFSKGGATIAELIADWDDGAWGPGASVVGAALLDPPMAAGGHGWLQSAGRFVGPIPDDGGYDPVHCRFLGFWCDDRRAHLGDAAGVEVIVIRNPRAALTSFGDVPAGLRVYDADDGGPGPLQQLVRNPFRWPGRITEAHESVLSDPRVAACIAAEAWGAGECRLPRRGEKPSLPSLRRPAIAPPSGRSVL